MDELDCTLTSAAATEKVAAELSERAAGSISRGFFKSYVGGLEDKLILTHCPPESEYSNNTSVSNARSEFRGRTGPRRSTAGLSRRLPTGVHESKSRMPHSSPGHRMVSRKTFSAFRGEQGRRPFGNLQETGIGARYAGTDSSRCYSPVPRASARSRE